MAFTIPAAPGFGQIRRTIPGVVNLMGGANPPANIAFPSLGGTPNSHFLMTGESMPVQRSPVPEVTRAVGLITCASVCFHNTANDLAYVLHTGSGLVTHVQFMAAVTAILAGPPFDTVYIAYAHRSATDPGYQAAVANFVNWGVPTNNIVEITNLPYDMFGMNNELQIGY